MSNIFEIIGPKSLGTVGFLISFRSDYSNDDKHYFDTFYVPKDELKLGANRIILGQGTEKIRFVDSTKCTCPDPRFEDDDYEHYDHCYCSSEYFYYGQKIEKTRIADNRGVEIEELDKVPEWIGKTFKQAIKEKDEFMAKWNKENPRPKREKKEKPKGFFKTLIAYFTE